jgi:Hint module
MSDLFVMFYNGTSYITASVMFPPPPPLPTKPPQRPPIPTPPSIPSNPVPSPNSNPVPSPPPTSCFSGVNTVEVKGVGHVPMNLLGIGDLVKSGDGTFTQVYGFGHLDYNLEGTFLRISFEKNDVPSPVSSIEISARHLVMIEKEKKQYRIPAADIAVGDILSGQRVHTIQEVVRRGVYAPLTQSGEIIVSGILASNYVKLVDLAMVQNQHTIGHLLFTSQRFFCRYFIDTCKNERYVDGYGVLAYVIVTIASFIQQSQTIFVTTFKLHLSLTLVCIVVIPAIIIIGMSTISWKKYLLT